MLWLPSMAFAQSPLTVQPSTGRVAVGNTNPSEALDVNGTVKATFKADGSQLANLPGSEKSTVLSGGTRKMRSLVREPAEILAGDAVHRPFAHLHGAELA